MLRAPSTTVETALPSGERNPNRHHNVPQSRAGSNEDNNVSDVDPDRHDLFHQSWGSNATPTELVRFMALHSIGLPDKQKRLDPTQVRTVLEATNWQNWNAYYYDDTTTSASDFHGVLRSLQNLRVTSSFLSQEKVWVENTISAIRGEGAIFPSEEHLLLPNALKFFGVKTPTRAIEEFLDEKNNDQYSWTKPMRHQKRTQIHRILDERGGTALDNRKDYNHVLLSHHKTLDVQSREIERTLTKLKHELEKLLQMTILRPLDAS